MENWNPLENWRFNNWDEIRNRLLYYGKHNKPKYIQPVSYILKKPDVRRICCPIEWIDLHLN